MELPDDPRLRLLATALLASTLGAVPVRPVLPARNQALLLLRVLSYDRNLKARSGSELTEVIASRESERRCSSTATRGLAWWWPSAREEGADLDSAFLGIAEVIGRSPPPSR